MRYLVELQKIPEHERRFLEHSPGVAGSVLPEPPALFLHEQALLDFYLDERAATPSDLPLDKMRALDLYARLYGETDESRLVRMLRAMDAEYFAVRAGAPAREADDEGEETDAEGTE